MPTDTPKITLEEVAQRSGVSITTVSRVINASRPVGKDAEQRVKHAMKELGFAPGKRAKAHAKPTTVVLITEDVLNPASTAILAGAQDEADKLSIGLLTLHINKKPGMQKPSINLLPYLSCDAVILMHLYIEPDEIRKLCKDRNMPIILLERILDAPHVHCIDTNREKGMYQAAKYLISLNHKEIAYISCQIGEHTTIRLRGVQKALAEAGLTLEPHFQQWCSPSIEGGFQAASTILSRSSPKYPTAIIVFSDLLAIGAMRAVRACGFRIPDDISVVGFDNIYFTSYTNPPLTTVSQPLHEVGQLAVRKIYDSVHGYGSEIQGFTLLDCSLVVRESTGLRSR